MRCLVLFSGSLESLLAARLMQLQGVEPIGIFFRTLCSRRTSPADLAESLGMRLVAVDPDASYVEAIRHPTLGRTKGAAACLDCRVSLLRRAKGMMAEWNASFVVTGEVLGQRPRSQNRRDLDAVAYHAELTDLVVRPLSARLLDETKPEQEQWIDRQQLHAFHGNAHAGMIGLARDLGLQALPASRPDCGLADEALSGRTFDWLTHCLENNAAKFESLTLGRHFRFDPATKVILGRNQEENAQLQQLAHTNTWPLLEPINFVGPVAVVEGPISRELKAFSAALVRRFGKSIPEKPLVRLTLPADRAPETLAANPHRLAESAKSLGTRNPT